MIFYNTDPNDKEMIKSINYLNAQNNKKYAQLETKVARYDPSMRKWCLDEKLVDYRDYLEIIQNWRGLSKDDRQKLLDCSFISLNRLLNKIYAQLKLAFDEQLKDDYINPKMSDYEREDYILQQEYILEGEIVSFKAWGNQTPSYSIKLTDKDLKSTLNVYVPYEAIENYTTKFESKLRENKVRIQGFLEAYTNKDINLYKIQLKANTFIVLDEKNFYEQQLETWQEQLDEEKIYPPKTRYTYLSKALNNVIPQRIGVISSEGSEGYIDFETKMKKFSYYTVNPEWVETLSAKNIAQKISDLQKSNYDCICIIRGGGSKHELMDFNNYILVKAIYQSKKPILLAIGHTSYHFIVDKFANYCATTPTQLASDFISWFKWKEAKELTENKQLTMENLLIEKNVLEEQLDKQSANNKMLSDKIDLLQRERKKAELIRINLRTEIQELEIEKNRYKSKCVEQNDIINNLRMELAEKRGKSLFATLASKLFGK